jgi:hypothetical protein
VTRSLGAGGLIALLAILGCDARRPSPAPPPPASVAMADLPAGEGRADFDRLCLDCHSVKYVTGQPLLARKTWERVLEKHVHDYGAPLTTEESSRVLAYVLSFKEKR